jgi:hypothetical protein
MSMRGLRCALICIGTLLAVLVGASPALAGAWWQLSARAAPTNLPPGGQGLVDVAASDVGDQGIDGSVSRVRLTDTLPEGLTVSGGATAVKAHRSDRAAGSITAVEEEAYWSCTLSGSREVACETRLAIPAYETLKMEIPVEVQESPGTHISLSNRASVTGGEVEGTGGIVPGVSTTRPLRVSDEPVVFGLEEDGYSIVPENNNGGIDARAGSHPYQLTSTVFLNQTLEEVQLSGEKPVKEPAAPALTKSLRFSLPPGLLGNVQAAERCTGVDFSALENNGRNLCPAGSAIGVATVTAMEPHNLGYFTLAVPVFNLEPAQGEPARFGFEAEKIPVFLDASVRTDGDYGVTVGVTNTTEAAQVLGAQVTLWGEPGDQIHDSSRGWACLLGGAYVNKEQPCRPPDPRSATPFLTLPTSCEGGLETQAEGDSWTGGQLLGEYAFQNGLGGPLERLEGCSGLPFDPSIEVRPEQQEEEGRAAEHAMGASTPTGLNVDVKVAQDGTLTPGGSGDADVRSTTVTLPEGVLLNPSDANGLQACSEAQIGYLGRGGESDPFAPNAPEPLRFSTAARAQCPAASKIGSVRIKTPLLGEELQGSVYLATPAPQGEAGMNPFGSLIALYIVAENETLGLRVKLAGEGHLNSQTGQISTTFENTPQVPFENLKLELFGGPRGPVTTPAFCGSYVTAASFTPWSSTIPFETAALDPGEEFNITSGPEGSACPSPTQPFAPVFQAGVVNLQAGAYTNFDLQIDRPGPDQALTGVSVHLPPGNAAILANVTPCPEPQASQGACGPESEIGQATATAGLGPDPYTVTGGHVYITGPYQGAPFGLSIVTPAVAGPFDLGNVVVRSSINVDPNTAAVTITSGLPTFVQGIGMPPSGVPLQLRQVNVTVDRPNFEFNPTNCNPMSITGTLTGAQGASANVSSPFQVSGCQNLPFKPDFQASTSGSATKANGASFIVKVTSHGLGEADIEKVDLQLPKALPARLTTLQKACTEHAFNTNPASCPEGSVIGTAVIHTPVLKNPLTGPAYLVSHGGAAFPDVEFVLQGENITLVLDGKTAIKNQLTYSKFEAAPDAPFTTFETVLPQGPHSALTSNVPAKAKFSLCGQTLNMPTEITAHNGTLIKQTTKIAVQGCKAVKASRAKKLARSQQLALALKHCRMTFKRNNHKRQACERQARKRYAPKKASARKRKAHKARTSS